MARFFFREYPADYQRYQFGYGHFAAAAPGEDLPALYAAGFLPASHDPTAPPVEFYRARSLRLDLDALAFDKKCRYLHRRGDQSGLVWRDGPAPEIAAELPADWESRVLAWVGARFDPPYLNPARLAYIQQHVTFNHLGVVTSRGRLAAIVVLALHRACAHYWFAFLDHACAPDASLGRWSIAAAARALQPQAVRHLYLGTVYGRKAAYKLQGITAGLEWFDGNDWRTDRDALEARLETDLIPPPEPPPRPAEAAP